MRKVRNVLCVVLCLILSMSLISCVKTDINDQTNQQESTSKQESAKSEEKQETEPVKKPLYEFTYLSPENPDAPVSPDTPIQEDICEKLNIKIKAQGVGYDEWDNKRNILFASGDVPDLMSLKKKEEASANAALFIDLKDRLSVEAPDYYAFLKQFPYVINAVKADDEGIYCMPVNYTNDRVTNCFWVRQDWLDKLSLEAPKTIEDVENILMAFKSNDLNQTGKDDIIPWVNRWGLDSVLSQFGYSFGTYLDSVTWDCYVNNGKVTFGPIEENFKQMVDWVEDLYTKDLLDPEFITRSSKEWEAVIASNRTGFLNANLNRLDWLATVGQNISGFKMVALPAPKSQFGDSYYKSGADVPIEYKAISKKAKEPDRILEWLNYFFTEEGIELTTWGYEGTHYVLKNGQKKYTDLIMSYPKGIGYGLDAQGLSAIAFPGIKVNTNHIIWFYHICSLKIKRFHN